MHVWPQVRSWFADERFLVHLLVFLAWGLFVLLAALVSRRILARCCPGLHDEAEQTWARRVGIRAVRRCQALVFWLSLLFIAATAAASVAYHMAGRDVRHEIRAWYRQFSVEQLYRLGGVIGVLMALGAVTEFVVWFVRRVRPQLQDFAHCTIGCEGNHDALHSWFDLVQRYAVVVVRLGAVWAIAALLGFGEVSSLVVGFTLRVLTVVVLARLVGLAVRTVTRKAHHLGQVHLAEGRLSRYWERISRLFPFGERCLEGAVYVIAASMCLHVLPSGAFLAEFGPRIVQCIGILFATRLVIELLQVVLYQAFGLYDDPDQLDAKGRTLVPLLQSICQYVLYFGSGVVMLGVLGVDTRPILAGAGILGLAVGLGAQSLVTDVVSGFFILFENQYLVGDYVQIGDAVGTVEAVSIRLTQVRDGHGKLYIIPNGQIKGVVNYSKGFVNAVVDVRVPSGSDLEGIFRSMAEAGRRLQALHREQVLAETHVQGVVELGTDTMTVRAVTRVQPGTHGAMQSEYRRLLKQVFDQQARLERPRMAAAAA